MELGQVNGTLSFVSGTFIEPLVVFNSQNTDIAGVFGWAGFVAPGPPFPSVPPFIYVLVTHNSTLTT